MARRIPVVANQKGFSLVELLLAMALFSFGLLIITLGFIALLRMYRTSILDKSVQHNTRTSIDRIVSNGRLVAGKNFLVGFNIPYSNLCMIGPGIMYYIQPDPDHAGLPTLYEAQWPKPGTPAVQCTVSTSVSGTAVALSAADTFVKMFTVTPVGGAVNTLVDSVQISLTVADAGSLTKVNSEPLPGVTPVIKTWVCNPKTVCSLTTLSTTVSSRSQ